MITCSICNSQRGNIQSLSSHVKREHGLGFKEYYDIHIRHGEDGVCLSCKKETTFYKGKYSKYCSSACAMSDPKVLDMLSKAVSDAMSNRTDEEVAKSNQKRQKYVKFKYGVDNVSILESVKQQKAATTLENYGSESYLATAENRQLLSNLDWGDIHARRMDTNIKKYGGLSPMASEDVRNKLRSTKRKDFFKHILQLGHIIKPLFELSDYIGGKKLHYKWKCSICGGEFLSKFENGIIPRCLRCKPILKSKMENELADYVTSLGVEIKRNDRTILAPMELDVLVPSKKVAFEISGLYWHSESGGGKDHTYHLNKTKGCELLGYRLVQIFEDEWLFSRPIVESRIRNILGLQSMRIMARNCDVKIVDPSRAYKFVEANHIQGSDNPTISYGLFSGDDLVSVMSFSKGRRCVGQTPKEGEWELSRFCSLLDVVVIGGASKLLNTFERVHNPSSIISYADRRWSDGGLYKKLGFQMHHTSRPSYWYFKQGAFKRFHRFSFRKNLLKEKLEDYNPTLTEWENMQANGWDRIWDCGTFAFVKSYPMKNAGGGVSAKP